MSENIDGAIPKKRKPRTKLIAEPGKWNGTLGTDACETNDSEHIPRAPNTESTDNKDSKSPGNQDTTERSTPQTDTDTDAERLGNASAPVAATGLMDGENQSGILVALAREGEGRAACWERLRKEARAAGMPRGQGPGTAYEWATREVERLFPPPVPVVAPDPEPIADPVEPAMSTIVDIPVEEPSAPTIVDIPPVPSADMGVSGLGELPESWPTLPANAQLQVEIAWVSANRLRVRNGKGVDLSRALSPAPSYSALSWLETSILFPTKFADISVKATAQQDDEREHIKREKMAIEEIRGILKEMMEG